MIDLNLKYQIAIFGVFEDITPNSDTLKYLIETFADKELIPTTFQELNPLIPDQIINRLSLKSSDDVWTIEFSSNRIDIIKSNTNFGVTKMNSVSEFINDVKDIIKKINDKFPKKYNRLALVTRHLLKEMSIEEMSSIYHKTVKTVETYQKSEPVEWNNRVVARIPVLIKNEETFNIISEINRIRGNLKINSKLQIIDRVELKFDINTFQAITDYRFDFEDLKIFLDKALEIEENLELEYIKLIS
ncbi:MAG: hypothetical protein QM535_22615 [Limnohabitans sp.]|nr:hypothetical protein [Limnohabitans sp.]